MSTQKLLGHIIDEDGFELEVWIDEDLHFYIMYGGSQIEDFDLDSTSDLGLAAAHIHRTGDKIFHLPILAYNEGDSHAAE